MKEYRRRPKSDVWHFNPRCRWFPVIEIPKLKVFVTEKRPTYGELCNECQAKEREDQRKADSFGALRGSGQT